ncbi:MAG TPA: acyl carrier protein [Pilimelia sp.]|nr:acyl carrier protein [Pilimelia sp.]
MATDRAVMDINGQPAPPPTVERVSQIVAGVLGVATIGPEDDLFDLDTSSLQMVQIVAKSYQVFGVEVPLPDLFDGPTVASLVSLIERERDRL